MQRYILERAGQSLVSLLVVVSLVFVLARLTGNPLDLLLDDYASEDTKARVAADLGLDQPWPTQYVIYLGKIVQGDFGRSIRSNRPAMAEVLERVPATLQLGLTSMALTLLVAPVVGVYAAVNRGRWFDAGARLIAMLPGKPIVFTNGGRSYAERITARIGLAGLFDDLFDIEAAGFIPKPQRASFAALIERHDLSPDRTLFFEDSPRNLETAHDLGFRTVLIDTARKENESFPAHVHHASNCIKTFLRDTVAPALRSDMVSA